MKTIIFTHQYNSWGNIKVKKSEVDYHSLVENPIGLQWESAPDETTIIPYTAILEIKIIDE